MTLHWEKDGKRKGGEKMFNLVSGRECEFLV